jgi:hypothetical protein
MNAFGTRCFHAPSLCYQHVKRVAAGGGATVVGAASTDGIIVVICPLTKMATRNSITTATPAITTSQHPTAATAVAYVRVAVTVVGIVVP